METINNLAGAASKTIFGDSSDKKEPVSGATGDVSKGEPFDAGNLDPEDQKKFDKSNPATPFSVKDDPVASATTSDAPAPKGDTSVGQTDPKEEPTATSDHPEETTVEPMGPGPKPVAQLAAEHGGDAGKAGVPTESTEKKTEGESTTAAEEANKDEPGHKIVHATGLQADGGDFDAKNPGAGQEADRLMEEKGIKHTESGGKKDEAASDKPSSNSSTPKKKLSERIKAKFSKKKD